MKTSLLVVHFYYALPLIIFTFISPFTIRKSTSALVLIAAVFDCTATMSRKLGYSCGPSSAFPIPLAIRASVVPANPVIDSDQDAN